MRLCLLVSTALVAAAPTARGDSCSPPADDPLDPLSADRNACRFGPGARAVDTLGDLAAARRSLTHLVVIMQENRSVDHLYGSTGRGIEGIPDGYSNPDGDGNPIPPFRPSTACVQDIAHSWSSTHTAWNAGAMDGFVRGVGVGAMASYLDQDHPFYTWLLTTFSTSDRYFCSVLASTWPNRDYLLLGTSEGIMDTGGGFPSGRTVFDQLDDAGVGWAVYLEGGPDDVPLEGTLGWSATHRGVLPFSQFGDDARQGRLPPVTMVDTEIRDEHPPNSLHDGENFVRSVVTAMFQSPLWGESAIVITYDEGGGFFDHVPPPCACLADPSQSLFNTFGVRVPLFVVSPWSRPTFVSHQAHSHTSVLRLIQAVFDLPALTGRDANSDALLDLFDFGAPAFATPPAEIPDAAPPGCAL